MVDFKEMIEKDIPNFKNGEGEFHAKIFSDNKVKIISGRLEKGESIGEHIHESSSEIIYVLSGKASFIFDGEKEIVEAGNCHYCPKGHTHSLKNEYDDSLTFFAVVPEQ